MRHKLNINIWLSFQLRSNHKKHTHTKSCRDHKGRRTTTTTSRKWPTYEFMMHFCCLVLWLVCWISTPHLKAKREKGTVCATAKSTKYTSKRMLWRVQKEEKGDKAFPWKWVLIRYVERCGKTTSQQFFFILLGFKQYKEFF